jgi:Protein of unknown function (DUF1176)
MTALGAPGTKPASAVPAAPALPRIAAVIADQARPVPRAVPRALVQRHQRETADDECDLGRASPSTRIIRLSARTLLFQIQCWRSASQTGAMFYLGTDAQPAEARRLSFETIDPDTGRTGMPIQALTSPSGLEEMSLSSLSAIHNDRGAGDCGTAATWFWTGRDFKLGRYTTMPICRGVHRDDWIPLWRTATD